MARWWHIARCRERFGLSGGAAVQEIFGVHTSKDVCRRFKLGYFAISANCFARQGDVSNQIPKDHDRVVSKVRLMRR